MYILWSVDHMSDRTVLSRLRNLESVCRDLKKDIVRLEAAIQAVRPYVDSEGDPE